MVQKTDAEVFYLRAALSEAFRVLDKDKGHEFVDELIQAAFKTHNVQERFLEAFNDMIPADIDQSGRKAVLDARDIARDNSSPMP